MKFTDEISVYNTNEIERRLITSDTKFEVLRGYIGAIITEAEIDELRNGDKTMYSRLASSELTIDGLTRQFSEMETSYDSLSGEYSTLNTRTLQIQETVSGVVTTVSEVKTTAEGADTKVTNLAVTVNGVSSRVEQAKTEAIAEAGTATDAKLKDYKKTTELMSYINQQSGSINLGVIKNSSTLATNSSVAAAKTEAISAANTNTANLLKSYTKTADLTIDIDGIRTKVTEASIDLTGTKNAAVTAAGEATDNKLKDYKKTTELMSYINQQSGSINLGVIKNSSTLATNSSVVTAKTEAISAANTNTANLLKSYTKTADLTIDIDGIRTKVTEASIDLTGTKNAAVTAAGEATDAKLKDYKKTTELMSYINQQSGSINLGVIKNSSTLATNSSVATAKNEAISNAKSYADTKASDAVTAANNNTANVLKQYTKTADLTIDIDGISTKVTEANIDLSGTQQAAETASKNYTDNKLQEYTKTESLISYINQKSGSINLGVIKNSNTLATNSSVATAKSEAINSANTNTANMLKSYTKTADLTIDINGISTKVTEANIDLSGTQQAAETASKNYTDNKLQDYKKTTELISYINQQAGSISLGVIEGNANLATKTNVADAKSEAISSANTNTTNQLKSYTKTADLKISIDGVKMQFADANIDLAGTKKEATSAAKSYTDSQLGDYTKTTELISYINLQSGRIALGVIDGGSNLATKSNVATAKEEAISSANTSTTNTLKNYATKTYADQAEADAKTYADNKLKPATIVAEINSAGSSIKLNANKINMDADTLELWGNSIRLVAGTIVWLTDKSGHDEYGNMWCKAFSASGSTKIAAKASSYVKLSDYYSTGDVVDSTKKSAQFTIDGVLLNDGSTKKTNYKATGVECSPYSGTRPYAYYRNTGAMIHGSTEGCYTNVSDLGIYIYWGSASNTKSYLTKGGLVVNSSLKSRAVDTKHYGTRLMYCYEMTSPSFGDIGEGIVAEDGKCYIRLDPVFAETISEGRYQVFIQSYGDGKAYIAERHPDHFIVEGTPGLAFGWEIKSKQIDAAQVRMEESQMRFKLDSGVESADFATAAQEHINSIYAQREVV